jgi:hypothetical protein
MNVLDPVSFRRIGRARLSITGAFQKPLQTASCKLLNPLQRNPGRSGIPKSVVFVTRVPRVVVVLPRMLATRCVR